MPFRIIRNDITKVSADAIVNTANPHPTVGRGTDSAIYEAAGREDLLRERIRIGRILPGEVAVTPAFNLDAKYIIHTVGPAWHGGKRGEFAVLASCYRKSLLMADQLGCASIAFPLISTGVYGFPKDKALDTALKTIAEFISVSDMDITLVVYDKTAFDLSEKLVDDVSQFIDDNYVGARDWSGPDLRGNRRYHNVMPYESDDGLVKYGGITCDQPEEAEFAETSLLPEPFSGESIIDDEDTLFPYEPSYSMSCEAPSLSRGSAVPDSAPVSRQKAAREKRFRKADSIDDLMKDLGQTFQERLLRLIDERGLTDTQVYKRANLDRKLFSKIRCNADYKPSKSTALALAVGLRLNLDETVDLLGRAGLALSPSSRSDLVVQYCIMHEIYDIYEVNALLFNYDLQTLN